MKFKHLVIFGDIFSMEIDESLLGFQSAKPKTNSEFLIHCAAGAKPNCCRFRVKVKREQIKKTLRFS